MPMVMVKVEPYLCKSGQSMVQVWKKTSACPPGYHPTNKCNKSIDADRVFLPNTRPTGPEDRRLLTATGPPLPSVGLVCRHP